MKKNVLGVAVILLAAACGGSETKEPATPTVTSASAPTPAVTAVATTETPAPAKAPLADLIKKSMMTMQSGWEAHDAKKILPAYADDVTFSMPGPMGWQDFKKADIDTQMTQLFAAFPDAAMTPTRVLVKGNVVVSEGVFTGTNSGEFMGHPATGKKVGYHMIMISTFNDDGLISKSHLYYDGVTVMAQLGVKGMKGRAAEAAPSLSAMTFVQGKNSADETKEVDAVKAWYALVEKKDEKGLTAALQDDVVHTDYSAPTDVKGTAGVKKEFNDLYKTFPDLKMTATDAWAFDNFVVAEVAMTGTMKGAMGPIKATNKNGTIHVVDVFEFNKDGKVKSAESFGSRAEAASAFGVAPPPGAKADATKTDGTKGDTKVTTPATKK